LNEKALKSDPGYISVHLKNDLKCSASSWCPIVNMLISQTYTSNKSLTPASNELCSTSST